MQAAKREVDAHMAGHHFFFQVVVLKIKCFRLKSSGQRQEEGKQMNSKVRWNIDWLVVSSTRKYHKG